MFFKKRPKEAELPLPELEAPPLPAPEALPEEIKPEIKEGPLFVASEEYRKITEAIDTIRARLAEATTYAEKIEGMREEAEKLLARWQEALESIERRLSSIDAVLAKGVEV